MTDGISPYALLKASKPKETATFQTPYDLYSGAQRKNAPPAPPAQTPQAPPQPTALQTARRTHYIADIHTRHSAAARKTPL